jgi:ring-1,2-phenylacetyl-CoA epoxidase subunit PaaE
MSTTFHSLKIKDIKRETIDTVSIYFEVPADLKSEYDYAAGQYLTLRATINGEDVRRS